MNDETTKPFASLVWDTLADIDVGPYCKQIEATAKRPVVTYLPWHQAWMLLKRAFPASFYEYMPDIHHVDGSIEVGVVVSISDGSTNRQTTTARLAVMTFNAIANPNAREVNDSRQRVLVKALAFAGLGLNLWDKDSEIPVGRIDEVINDAELAEIEILMEATKTDATSFLRWAEAEHLADMSYTKFKSAKAMLEAKRAKQLQDEDVP